MIGKMCFIRLVIFLLVPLCRATGVSVDLLTLPSPQVVETDRVVKIPESCSKHLIFSINKKMRIAGKQSVLSKYFAVQDGDTSFTWVICG